MVVYGDTEAAIDLIDKTYGSICLTTHVELITCGTYYQRCAASGFTGLALKRHDTKSAYPPLLS